MPRMPRVKNESNMYHIIVRSIKEINLFEDDNDKKKYLSLIKKYQVKYGFAVYAYCLMSNHGHFIIDCLGADISKIMQSINLSYAFYFNRKYNRYGPVFQDRFKSKVVTNEKYMINLSAYIHNNPKDIIEYKNKVELYPFSSLREYINQTNTFGVLTHSFLATLIGFKNKKNQNQYIQLVHQCNDMEIEKEIEFISPKTMYMSLRKIIPRSHTPNEVISYVSKHLNQNSNDIYMKYRRDCTDLRALSCFLMATFCNMNQKDICERIGNITQAGISYLTSKGLDIASNQTKFLDNFLTQ